MITIKSWRCFAAVALFAGQGFSEGPKFVRSNTGPGGGVWSENASWNDDIQSGIPLVPRPQDVARVQGNHAMTLDSVQEVTGLAVSIFNHVHGPGYLTIPEGGCLLNHGDGVIAARSNNDGIGNVGMMTLDGGSYVGAGMMKVAGDHVSQVNTDGTLQVLDGSFVLGTDSPDGRLAVGFGGEGSVGTLNLSGGTVDVWDLVVGTEDAQGRVNLNGGLLTIRHPASGGLDIHPRNGRMHITDGVLEWQEGDFAGQIEAFANSGWITWGGTTTEMLFDTWDSMFLNDTSTLFIYRDTEGGISPNSTFVWSTLHEADSRPAFIVNTRLFRTHGNWHKLVPWNSNITALRLPAGSRGQWTWGCDEDIPQIIKDDPEVYAGQVVITDEMIEQYAAFAEEKGVETYYALNINDTLQNQMDLLDRFLAEGVNITHVELGNENYLPKFRNGGPWGALGFVTKITYDDYCALASEWLPTLKLNYPSIRRLIVGASKNDEHHRGIWNSAILDFLHDHPFLCDGVVLHLYVGGDQQDEEEAVEDIFNELDSWDMWPLPIHVTESGDRSVDYSEEGLQRYRVFQRRVFEYLEYRADGSRMGTHVLHTENIGQQHYALMYDENGATPVGLAAMDYPYEPLDTDGDGIPDWWERQHFGGPMSAVASDVAANAVNSVYEAYVAGLDPHDPQSVFNLERIDVGSGSVTLRWTAMQGRTYSVYWTPVLSTPFEKLDVIPYPGTFFQDEANTHRAGFYQLKVGLSP